jgi:hypothetical protein
MTGDLLISILLMLGFILIMLLIATAMLGKIAGLLAAQNGNLGTISGQLSRLDDIYYAISNHK